MTATSTTLAQDIPTDHVTPNAKNLRHRLGELGELVRSVEAVGIIEPLLVTPNDDGTFTVIAGHRRLAAAKAAGKPTVPCVVRAITEVEAVELTLIENGQRNDLNCIEEAEGYYRLFEAGRSVTEMSNTLGRTAKHITRRLALLELPKKAQRALERSTISLADAEALLAAREHPDLIETTIDSLNAQSGDQVDVKRAIEQGLRERRREEAVTALRAKADDRGLNVVEYEGYQPASYRTLVDGLDLDADARRRHRREPCHAVTIEARWDGRAELVEVCTEWRRHTASAKKDARSSVQVSATSSQPAQRERDTARRAWTKRRGEFVASALAGRAPKATVVETSLQTLVEQSGANVSRRAAQMLGIDAANRHGYEDWHGALVEHSTHSAATLVRTAAAVVAAHGEEELRGGYRPASAYRALLDSLGYAPDEGEFPADEDVHTEDRADENLSDAAT